MAAKGTKVFCQWCGKDTTGAEKTFYGNVLCGEECREKLSEAVYFRDDPPDPNGTWLCPHCGDDYFLYGHQHSFGREGMQKLADAAGAKVERYDHMIPLFECRRYKWFPPLKWLIWGHFKNSGTLGALIEKA